MTPTDMARIHASAMRVPAPWTAETILAFAESPGGFVVAADHGFALGRAIAGEAELLTLAVEPEHQGKGEGRALLDTFESRARRDGAETAYLEVAVDNAPALALYRSSGWREVGRRKRYYDGPDGARIDALILEKPLTRSTD